MNSSLTKVQITKEQRTKLTRTSKVQSKRFARQLANYALGKKGDKVLIMDLRKLTSMTDFFVICSGDSEAQVKAITDHIEEKMKKRKIYPLNREGYTNLKWVLLDYFDVIMHVFHKDTRNFYNLESLWGDAKIESIIDKPAAGSSQK